MMIDFEWMVPSPMTEWMVNSIVSVVVVASIGWLLVSFIPIHRAKRRSGVIIGIFVALLALPLVRGWSDSFQWNRVSLRSAGEALPEPPLGDVEHHVEVIEATPLMMESVEIEVPLPSVVAEFPVEEEILPRRLEWITLNLTSVLLLIWGVGMFVGLVRLTAGGLRLRRLDRRLARNVDAELVAMWRRVAGKEGENVLLRRGPEGCGAFTFGLRRRQIVIASDLLSTVSDEEAFTVLAHEWAHIQNRDTWVGLLQRVTTTIYWWLPLVHWMNRRLSLSREMLCDAAAAVRVDDPRFYAHSLLNLAAQSCRLKPVTGAIGIAGSQSALADRLLTLTKHYQSMKMTVHDPHFLRLPLAVIAASGLSLGFQLGIAQNDAAPPASSGAGASVEGAPSIESVSEAAEAQAEAPAPAPLVIESTATVVDALVAEEAALAGAISTAPSAITASGTVGRTFRNVPVVVVTEIVRGSDEYEAAAAPLREGKKEDFKFDDAKLGDVVAMLVAKSGVDYISELGSQGAGMQEVTFSFTQVTPFVALERLAKHFDFSVTIDDGTWSIKEKAPPLTRRTTAMPSGFFQSSTSSKPKSSRARVGASAGGGFGFGTTGSSQFGGGGTGLSESIAVPKELNGESGVSGSLNVSENGAVIVGPGATKERGRSSTTRAGVPRDRRRSR